MKEKKQIINKLPLFLSFLFLFNPNIAIIDVLPDFIGYLLICAALSKIADLNDTLWNAYSAFKRMIYIDAGKILAIFWIFGMSDSRERDTSILLWCFVFAVAECIILIPAFVKLFDGLTALGYLIPNNSVVPNGDKKSKTGLVKLISIVFVIVKAAMCTLPEFSVLTKSTYDETGAFGTVDLYDFIGIMRAMAFLPALILGITWVVSIIMYFRTVIKDTEFIEILLAKYKSEVLPKTGLFVRRNFKTFTVIMIIGLVMTLDLRFDGQNVLPDFLSAIILTISLYFLCKYNGGKKKHYLFSCGALIYSCVISAICEYMFFNEYYLGALIRSENARSLYAVIIGAQILKSLSFFAVMLEIYGVLCRTISEHTGFVVGMSHGGAGESKMVLTLQKELKREVIYAMITALLYMIAEICYVFIVPNFVYMGFIDVVFNAICVVFFAKALYSIQQAMDTKYMLE